ncbi:MAG: hypothetical protein HXY43_20490 [Fischerella sp.]|nr:hypothetical protein [Fischerella sp.]
MSSTFFTPLIILVLFNLSSYFYTKLDELTLTPDLEQQEAKQKQKLSTSRKMLSGTLSKRALKAQGNMLKIIAKVHPCLKE